MRFDYQTICHSTLLKDLPERQKEVISRRFGLGGKKETLESIGGTFGVTRERIRQIEEDGLKRLQGRLNQSSIQSVSQYFLAEFKKTGGLRKEDALLYQLGGEAFQNHVFFLLTLLGKPFQRFGETEDFYSFWTIDQNVLNTAKKIINSFSAELKNKKQSLLLPQNVLPSYIEISKNILKGPDGLYGLPEWPEVNPRGIKDRAYIILKKENTPLHFTRVASLINSSSLFGLSKPVVFQTVHNELIKDPRFVLVGRGLYALREQGYEPGVVKEVIAKVLKDTEKPLAKEEIVKKVLEQRRVKPNTILLNLQNKKYFIKNSEGKYTIRKV